MPPSSGLKAFHKYNSDEHFPGLSDLARPLAAAPDRSFKEPEVLEVVPDADC